MWCFSGDMRKADAGGVGLNPTARGDGGLVRWAAPLAVLGLVLGCGPGKVVNETLSALTSPANDAKANELQQRLAESAEKWADAAVRGAMAGWSDPLAQRAFKEATATLAAAVTRAALDGLADDELHAKLATKLDVLLTESIVAAGRGVDDSLRPAIGRTTYAAGKRLVDGVAAGLRDSLNPAIRDGLSEALAVSVERTSQQIAASLDETLTPALERTIERISTSVGDNLHEQLDRLDERLHTGGRQAGNLLAWILGAVAVVLLIAGATVVWWLRRHGKQARAALSLVVTSIKRNEDGRVRELLSDISDQGRGTDGGNYLAALVERNPTLNASRSPHG